MAMSGTKKALLIVGGILAVLFLVAIIGIAILVAAFRKGEPTIANNSLLTLRVAGSLPAPLPFGQRNCLGEEFEKVGLQQSGVNVQLVHRGRQRIRVFHAA